MLISQNLEMSNFYGSNEIKCKKIFEIISQKVSGELTIFQTQFSKKILQIEKWNKKQNFYVNPFETAPFGDVWVFPNDRSLFKKCIISSCLVSDNWRGEGSSLTDFIAVEEEKMIDFKNIFFKFQHLEVIVSFPLNVKSYISNWMS